MDITQKIKALLDNSFRKQYEMRGLLTAHHTMTDLVANGVTIQEWIPVSEPPKENGQYLVCGPTLDTCVKDFCLDYKNGLAKNVWYEYNSLIMDCHSINNSVSHWMPLPKRKEFK